MSIRIDKEKCTGCKMCTSVCPGNLISMDTDSKAVNRSPKDCWGCAACVKECRFKAIDFFLGEDIGGSGMTMSVEKDERGLNWIFKAKNSEETVIETDSKSGNKY